MSAISIAQPGRQAVCFGCGIRFTYNSILGCSGFLPSHFECARCRSIRADAEFDRSLLATCPPSLEQQAQSEADATAIEDIMLQDRMIEQCREW